MANHKSAQKRIRQTVTRSLVNRMQRSSYRTQLKKFLQLIKDNSVDAVKKQLPQIHRAIDKARSANVISKNAAIRKKSKITQRANQLIQ